MAQAKKTKKTSTKRKTNRSSKQKNIKTTEKKTPKIEKTLLEKQTKPLKVNEFETINKKSNWKLLLTSQIIIQVVIFFIGLCTLILGAVAMGAEVDHGIWKGYTYNVRWVSVLNIIFGIFLMGTPLYLQLIKGPYWTAEKNALKLKTFKIIMNAVYLVIGLFLLIASICVLGNHYYETGYEAMPICNIIFGVILFSSPVLWIDWKN